MFASTPGAMVIASGRIRPGSRRRRRRLNPAKKALREVRQIKRSMAKNINFKFNTKDIATTLTSGTPIYQSMSVFGIGETDYHREGMECTAYSISWRFRCHLAAADTAPSDLRVVLIYDRRPAGVQATWTDVFVSAVPNSLISNSVPESRGKYQILYDQVFTLSPNGSEIVNSKGYIDLKQKKMIWNADSGTPAIADLRRGNIFFAILQLGNGAVSDFKIQARLKFVDDN